MIRVKIAKFIYKIDIDFLVTIGCLINLIITVSVIFIFRSSLSTIHVLIITLGGYAIYGLLIYYIHKQQIIRMKILKRFGIK